MPLTGVWRTGVFGIEEMLPRQWRRRPGSQHACPSEPELATKVCFLLSDFRRHKHLLDPECRRKGGCSSGGSALCGCFCHPMHLGSGSLGGLTIHTEKRILGAGCLGAPISLILSPARCDKSLSTSARLRSNTDHSVSLAEVRSLFSRPKLVLVP